MVWVVGVFTFTFTQNFTFDFTGLPLPPQPANFQHFYCNVYFYLHFNFHFCLDFLFSFRVHFYFYSPISISQWAVPALARTSYRIITPQIPRVEQIETEQSRVDTKSPTISSSLLTVPEQRPIASSLTLYLPFPGSRCWLIIIIIGVNFINISIIISSIIGITSSIRNNVIF